PFYHLGELGSDETIRGFTRGRFRDRDLLMGSVEYRYPIYQLKYTRTVDAVLFVDTGQVADNIFQDVAVSMFQVGYGGGFRFYNEDEELVARLEIGVSKEMFRIYLMVN
ncbi:MAG: BamA/TamA family outer membrane protein, partial [Candidatus Electryoneaceae bacterium]|nr:BamA/TamA family outer membrane protein [Candidatus Electryoneaceae bacterium]